MSLPKDYLSVSQINCYLTCPEQYRRRYVEKSDRINTTDQRSLILGKAFHRFADKVINSQGMMGLSDLWYLFFFELSDSIKNGLVIAKNPEITFDRGLVISEAPERAIEILEGILNEEDTRLYLTGYDEELKTKTVHRPSLFEIYKNLCVFFTTHYSIMLRDIQIDDTEKEINIFLKNGVKIKSYFDAVGFNKGTFRPVIIDWKTSKKKWSLDDAVKKQDIIYSYLTSYIYEEIPEFYYFVFFYSETTGNVGLQKILINHDDNSLSAVESDIDAIIGSIGSEAFPKNESAWSCSPDYCEFYSDCQSYKANIKVDLSEVNA
jgi:CRISPR/Cas system-associated exonuclease Cas4 (RecB family)